MRVALHRRIGTQIGEHAVLRFGCVLERPPVSIGRMTMLGHYAHVQHASIGADCLVGDHVLVVDGRRQHRFDRLDVPVNAQGGILEPVHIGDDCIIGGGSKILADVGDHCIVGAGAVVRRPGARLRDRRGQPGARDRRPAPPAGRGMRTAHLSLVDAQARPPAAGTRARAGRRHRVRGRRPRAAARMPAVDRGASADAAAGRARGSSTTRAPTRTAAMVAERLPVGPARRAEPQRAATARRTTSRCARRPRRTSCC